MHEKDYDKKEYMETLKGRAKISRVYQKHQMIGLMISRILGDEEHKSLYIRLAKQKDQNELIAMARNIAEKTSVKNKGAYFMTMISQKISGTRHQKSDTKISPLKNKKNE